MRKPLLFLLIGAIPLVTFASGDVVISGKKYTETQAKTTFIVPLINRLNAQKLEKTRARLLRLYIRQLENKKRLAERAKNTSLAEFYQGGIDTLNGKAITQNTGSPNSPTSIGIPAKNTSLDPNTSTTVPSPTQKEVSTVVTSSRSPQVSTNTSSTNSATQTTTGVSTSSSSIALNWTENLIYEAISNGEINRKIERGEIKMNPTSASKEMVVSALNRLRADYGLSSLTYNSILSTAAKKHSDYMIANGGSEGHNEILGKIGFSGKTPTDRANSLGYNAGVSESIAHIQGDIVMSLVQLLDVPYHRMGFLEDVRDIGFCTDASCHGVFEFGSTQTSNTASFIFPRNGSNIYRYNELISESPNPFPGYSLNGFVMSIWDISPIDQTKVRLVDVATNKDVGIRFAVAFNSTCTSSVCLTISTSQSNTKSSNTLHFMNTEMLVEGKTYMIECAVTNKDTITTNRSYFVAGSGKFSSNLLPTKASGKLSETGTTLNNATTITADNSQIKTGYLSITKNSMGKYTFSYVDIDAKTVYNLIFSQQDIDWIVQNKKLSTGGNTPPGYEMSVIENAKLMLANIRKPYNVSGGEFAMYEADAKLAR